MVYKSLYTSLILTIWNNFHVLQHYRNFLYKPLKKNILICMCMGYWFVKIENHK